MTLSGLTNTTNSTNNSESLKNRTLAKNPSQISSKTTQSISQKPSKTPVTEEYQKTRSTQSIRTQGSYKILNPE